jgi:pyrimidine-nucleoside phosphorylase
VDLSGNLGCNAVALLSNMEHPLGRWVGNAGEVNEAIQVLNGKGPEDTSRLCVEIAGAMLFAAGVADSQDVGRERAASALVEGKGLEKFRQMIEQQGGNLDEDVLAGKKALPLGKKVREIKAESTGWVTSCHAGKVGEALRVAGGGRLSKEEALDLTAAVEILKKTGDQVQDGDLLAKVYASRDKEADAAARKVKAAFTIGEKRERLKLVWGIRDSRGFRQTV